MKTSSLHHRSDRCGFIIPAAIVSMVVISLLALTGLYIAQNDVTANIGLSNSMKAFYAADAGAGQVLANWDPNAATELNPGDSIVTGWRTLDDGSVYRTSLLRIDAGLSDTSFYRLRTIGRPGAGLTAQRTIVTMVRSARIAELCCDAALTVQGDLRVQGTGSRVKISGTDTDPAAWGGQCSGATSDLSGIAMQDTSALKVIGTPIFEGVPPLEEDPSITDADFGVFGELTYEDLTKMADKRYPGGSVLPTLAPEVSGDRCLTGVQSNWGDPTDTGSPCFGYLPITYVSGDLTLSGTGIGQGVLLVDGDLSIPGDFEYYGLIIVQGSADIRGSATLHGGFMVRNGSSGTDQTTLAGDTQIQYSSCVIQQAVTRASRTTQLPGRYWFEVVD